MSLPYHRGHINTIPQQPAMHSRGGSQWGGGGTRDQRAEEASRGLLEEENDRKLVCLLLT